MALFTVVFLSISPQTCENSSHHFPASLACNQAHKERLHIIMQGCRKVVKSGGGNISDYVLLIVPYTSSGVWGHAPQKIFGIFVL